MRHFSPLVSLLLFASFPLAAVPVASAQSTPQINVDANSIEGPVSRNIFGQGIDAGDGKDIFDTTTEQGPINSGDGFWDPQTKAPVTSILALSRALCPGTLRYPGGALANNYNWHNAVGPIANRPPGWTFGLDEYMALCQAMGTQPLITVSDYVLPADQIAADNAALVDYLNAPATSGHPWAQQRAANGHAAPYGVKWFELGNESNLGNEHVQPHRQFNPQAYAQYALACVQAMKAVDPTIKVGIVAAAGYGVGAFNDWNNTVVSTVGRSADFLVVHNYAPGWPVGQPQASDEDLLMQACMAESDQFEGLLSDYRQMMRNAIGDTLPMAVTEYNAAFVFDDPAPLRFSYGVGLECADLSRIFLKPASGVSMANFFQLLNGYWGILRSHLDQPEGGTVGQHPAYPLFRLWGQHFGTQLITTSVVNSPTQSFVGNATVLPAQGTTRQTSGGTVTTGVSRNPDTSGYSGPGFAGFWTSSNSLEIDLNGFTGSAFPRLALAVPVSGQAVTAYSYRLAFEARYTPAAGTTASGQFGMEITDARGYGATGTISQVYAINVPVWKEFVSTPMNLLSDAQGIGIDNFFNGMITPNSGKLEVRNLRVLATPQPSLAVTPNSDSGQLSGSGFHVFWTSSTSIEADLTNFTGTAFPRVGTLVPPAGKSITDYNYTLSFQARYTPSSGGTANGPLGMEIGDMRGYQATQSISQVNNIQQPSWTSFTSVPLNTLGDAPGVGVDVFFVPGSSTVTGKLEVRYIQIQATPKPRFVTLTQDTGSGLSGSGFNAYWTGSNSAKIDLSNFTGDAYPELGRLNPLPGKAITDSSYTLSFQAQYASTGGNATGTLGLEMGDTRGSVLSRGSIVQVKGIDQSNPTNFTSQPLNPLSDAPGIGMGAIFELGTNTASGTLTLSNIQVQATNKPSFPVYAVLTSAASLSADGKKLYLIVFNKSTTQNIATHVNLSNFAATSAKLWQVNAPALTTTDGVAEVASGKPITISGTGLDQTFPAHSMTAIEISR